MSFIHTIERTKKHTPRTMCIPGSIIHKKLLMQNKDKVPASQDARVHYAVPKQQPRRTHHPHTRNKGERVGLGHAREH
jgi:hypothetical protein